MASEIKMTINFTSKKDLYYKVGVRALKSMVNAWADFYKSADPTTKVSIVTDEKANAKGGE